MRYGFFDDPNYEYVIERPDTPRSWSNYIGSRLYGGVITNNAGGYSFYRSPAKGRFLRLRFNSIPTDQPGRYFYLRDRDSADYWSAAWQPVGKPLDQYRSTCRFGMGYAVVESAYSDIRAESTYFVPLGQAFEYWRLRLTNESKKARKLSVFTYCEFASEWNIFQDGFNLQYSAYVVQTELLDGIVRCSSLNNVKPDPERFANGDQGRWSWLTLTGGEIVGHELDREEFLGPYRGYSNPRTVEEGRCRGSRAYGGNACGCLQVDVDLKPGETRELLVLLGAGKAEIEGQRVRAEFATSKRCQAEFDKLKRHWRDRLGRLTVRTPDADFDHMVNVWNAYNALMTFEWSRACSLVYTGDNRDGYGFRDTVQDILAVVPAVPEQSRERIELMLTGQEAHGGARPEVDPVSHRPGQMPPASHYRSDDCLWFFNTIPEYVAETGEVDFYKKVVPYSDKGEATVFQHLRRALDFNIERSGAHGLPCGLTADWNDCLKLGARGESLFVAFQLRYGLVVYAEIAELLRESSEAQWAQAELKKLDAAIQQHAWDGEWFVRAYREDGAVIGSARNDEGRIFLNTQSWAVLSGAAKPEQAETAMNSVEKHLASEYGLALCSPAYQKVDYHVIRAVLFNPGQKENAGIFTHTQGWAVMADCLLGHGDRAYAHYRSFMPSRYNEQEELREIEPYVHCQTIESVHSKKPGVGHVPWLTGAATWAYFAATQYILGIRPELKGLRIDPCLPRAWNGFLATRRFRGKDFGIEVKNGPKGKGVKRLLLNGEPIDGNLIPIDACRKDNRVEVELL